MQQRNMKFMEGQRPNLICQTLNMEGQWPKNDIDLEPKAPVNRHPRFSICQCFIENGRNHVDF